MNLNTEQNEAVYHVNGPLLILAGAGSGKTRVLTERIANLISKERVQPYQILAVTFTNKAAKEMKERISKRIGEEATKNIWAGTFHSICSKILRYDIHLLGRNSNFVIYDSTDQAKIITECLKKLNLDPKSFPANKILSAISKAKSNTITAQAYSEQNRSYGEQKIADIYLMYDEELKKNNALDFDDMLFYVVRILQENPSRLEYYQNKFRYILVDEYQDTNRVQYELIKSLSEKYRNLCVVGDVDQSIYSFRNADFRIILNFQEDYPEAKIIKLEKNYRSTQNIVNLSNEIIKSNTERFPKNLFTDNEKGEKIRIYDAQSDEEEVRFIIKEIFRLMDLKGYDYQDFTVLYRTNSQSRVFEEYFIRNNIPHQIIGGFKFFERKEIKDLLSYLKLIFNPSDSISLQRIINVPKRSIGATTMQKLLDIAETYKLSLWDVLNFQSFDNISPSTQNAIKEFVKLINGLIYQSNIVSVSKLIKMILEETNYLSELQKEDEKEGKDSSRVENVYQLINSSLDFETNSDDVSLEAYLSYISLVSDVDSIEGESKNVKLMTIHTSKGLEFPVVFVAGVAEGLFPHFNSQNNSEVEEERRLMYVATTRAREMLYLTFPRTRFMYGSIQSFIPSRFINECPPELTHGYNFKQSDYQKIHDDFQYSQNKKSGKVSESFSDSHEYFSKNKYIYNEPFSDEYPIKKTAKFTKNEEYESKSPKPTKKLDNIAIQASLEKRYLNTTPSEKSNSFKEGDLVATEKWGEGKISKIMKNNQKVILIINFESVQGSKIIDPTITTVKIIR